MTNKKKILYAEDHNSTRECTIGVFHEIFDDYEIESFKDGSSLDKRLNEDVNDVAAVITDNDMPGFNGGDLIKKYATNEKFKKIPFILFYGGDESIGKEALFNGAFTYAKKNFFNIYSIESCIREVIGFCEEF